MKASGIPEILNSDRDIDDSFSKDDLQYQTSYVSCASCSLLSAFNIHLQPYSHSYTATPIPTPPAWITLTEFKRITTCNFGTLGQTKHFLFPVHEARRGQIFCFCRETQWWVMELEKYFLGISSSYFLDWERDKELRTNEVKGGVSTWRKKEL